MGFFKPADLRLVPLIGLCLGGMVVTSLAQDADDEFATDLDDGSAWWDFSHDLHLSGEGLFTRDFQVTQWSAQYGQEYERFGWDFGFTYDTYDVDLRSPDPFFENASAYADRVLVQASISTPINDRLDLQGVGGYYDGFQNFRSLWLHEYYAQIGAVPFFGGYPDVSPRGFQLGSQLRWEYLPGSGYLEATFGYLKDWIAPSAEFERETILGRSVIDSFTYRIASENLVSSRVRSLFELQLTDTAARERRFGVQESINVALTESLVLRAQAGWVTENPRFDAYFVGATLERDLGASWLVSVFGRYYHDSGEIQNSLPASNGPPGLESYQVGMGLRWVGVNSSVHVSGGPYFTRYEDADIEAPFFEDLYRSRDWGMVRVAYSLNF